MAMAWTASNEETLSQMVSIRPTPAARARSMTSAWSSANCGACRLTWLSISIARASRPRRGAQFADRGEEGVGAIQIDGLRLARQGREVRPRLRPAVEPCPLARRGRLDRHAA